MFNVAYGMYLTETVETPKVNSIFAGDTKHLCGLHCKCIESNALRSIFDRLRLSPQFTDSLGKDFTEFVEYVRPRPFLLQRVERQTKDRKKLPESVWWRYIKPKRVKKQRIIRLRAGPEPVMAYPYVRAKPTSDQELLLAVHRVIPSHVPHEVRGDLCQDLIVAILSGETTLENIQDVMHEHAKAAKKLMPDRFKTVSLDAIVPGTDGFTLMDRMTTQHTCYE